MTDNPMEQIRIHKVTLNVGVGEVGDRVQKAVKLLETITGSDAVTTESTESAKGFGLRDGLEIGAKTTIRDETARDVLPRLFDATDKNLSLDNFDDQGNFSFSVEEYINVSGIEYDPGIGMMGFDVAVTLERPGFRVKRRRNPRSLGEDHKITPEEAANFVQEAFGVEVEGV